jgi:hypothetical protein
MRSGGRIVKPLAPPKPIWHRSIMADKADGANNERAERLRAALRDNLRRRKGKAPPAPEPRANSPKPED